MGPTLKPSMEPSAAPSWQPFIIDSVNCDPNKAAPLQVLRWEDADEYSLRSWDFQTGEYKKEYNIDYFDGHVNAVAMWERADVNNYAIGSFGGNLSWFSKKKRINIGSLVYDTPNAGTVIGNDYYYARSPGKDERNCGIYFVEDIAGEPRFETTSNLCISKSVFEGAVLDFVAANEDDADRYGTSSTYVDDNEAEGLYLFGLGEQHEVLIVKIVDKMPQAYAVVDSVIDWRGMVLGIASWGRPSSASSSRRTKGSACSSFRCPSVYQTIAGTPVQIPMIIRNARTHPQLP